MNVTINKIAELAGVSRGTVDRVIHNRPGVKKEVKEKVENILETLNYKPNIAGRALVSINKNIKIGVVLAPDFNPFVEEVKRGVSDEAARIGAYGVELDVEVISSFNENEQLDILNRLKENGASAIAIVPVEKKIIGEKINELSDSGIPVITFNSDISNTKRMCHVGQDNYKAGRTVGGLAVRLLQGESSVGIIASTENLSCHIRRIQGFKDKIAKCPSISIASIEQNNDINDLAFNITNRYIEEIEDLKLIYLTGGGIAGVGRALKEKGVAGKIRVITHDLVPDSIELLKDGTLDFVIGQNPYLQGALPVKLLFDHIFMKEKPEKEFFYTSTDIFTGDNLEEA